MQIIKKFIWSFKSAPQWTELHWLVMAIRSNRHPTSRHHYHPANWEQLSLIYENDLSSLPEVRWFQLVKFKGKEKLELKWRVPPNGFQLVKPVSWETKLPKVSKQSFTNALALDELHLECAMFSLLNKENTPSDSPCQVFHKGIWTDCFRWNKVVDFLLQ